MHVDDLLALFECGVIVPMIYIYEDPASARRPLIGEVAWPVEYIASKFHKTNFVFAMQRAPDLQEVGNAVADWTQS